MTCIKHMDQREDGGFNYFVVFGDKCAPWDADESNCVQCASESDADKLVRLTKTPWVSVDDEMPPDGKLVTVYINRCGYQPNYYSQSSIQGGKWSSEECNGRYISHWMHIMPLPNVEVRGEGKRSLPESSDQRERP